MKPHPPISPKAFRDAMALIPAQVSVLTTDGPAGPYGITVSSLCPVSDTPPTVLACINRKGLANSVFKENKSVGVNVLGVGQEPVGTAYAGGLDSQTLFDKTVWELGAGSPPRLKQAPVTLDGHIVSEVEVGTHTVFFIEIDAVFPGADVNALVYYRRGYKEFR
ncbi:MAG: flavin reductase [Methylobacteriaceae bacterium]|nr:flavin reductase [Methylobacteriaceae bacterium]